MSIAYFIDLDGTLVPHGNPRAFLPGAKERLTEILSHPDNHVYFFSCWAFTPQDQAWLQQNFPTARGFIRKPLADHYIFVDDKHRTKDSASLCHAFCVDPQAVWKDEA